MNIVQSLTAGLNLDPRIFSHMNFADKEKIANYSKIIVTPA